MRKWFILGFIALLVIAVDQVSKAVIVQNLALYERWMPVDAIAPYFDITYIQNTGAAFGIFQNSNTIFALIAAIVAVLILVFYREIPDNYWLMQIALGMMLGGAVGNLIDRIIKGFVVDFFNVIYIPVFNIADSMVVVGTCALILLMWLDDRRTAESQETGVESTHAEDDASVDTLA